MKWISAEQQVTVSIYDEEHEEYLDKIMTVEEMLDTYTNEGCPTIYSNPEQTRWIPVSEKLPKAGEYIGDVAKYYLVQNKYGDMLVARFTHSEYWEQIYQLKPIADKIVAWKPLPEPYKAESECNKKNENPLTNSHFMTRFMRVD